MMTSKIKRMLRFGLVLGLGFSALNVSAQWRLKTLSWNLESGEVDIQWIVEQIQAMEGFDVLALSEVDPSFAEPIQTAAEYGEGAKGEYQASFTYAISQTGYDDRLLICWDTLRFEQVGDVQELHSINNENQSFRSPLVVTLRHRTNGTEFMVMVNHLARGNEAFRNEQATQLAAWVQEQTLPVIALGDYNFDYDIDEGTGNSAFDLMQESGDWFWIRPERYIKTQSSFGYNSILDFAFVANLGENWSGYSDIMSITTPFEDNDTISDHRPLDTTFIILPESEEEEASDSDQ